MTGEITDHSTVPDSIAESHDGLISAEGQGYHASPKLLETLVCPASGTRLALDSLAGELISKAAGLAYPIRDGIPIMLVDEARKID